MSTKMQALQDHCRRFEGGLVTAATPDEARVLKERICRELGASCRSEIVRELLAEHAESLIAARFALQTAAP